MKLKGWEFLAFLVGYITVAVVIGGLCIEYTVETWGGFFRERPCDVSFWMCALVAIPLATFALPAAAITWLLFVTVM